MEGNQKLVQLSMEDLENVFKAQIALALKDITDRIDRKYGVIPGFGDEKEQLAKTKKERLAEWIRALYRRDNVGVEKALTGLTTSGLGFVPEEFQTEVIRVADQVGIVRKVARVFSTDLPTINLHRANAEVSVSWVDAGAAIPESTPSFVELVLSVKKASAITAIYKELFEDAKFPIVDYLAELYGEAIAREEDKQGLAGTGSPFHGLVGGTISGQATVTSSATSYTGFIADELLDLPMSVNARYRNGAVYFMHPTVFSYIRRLTNQQRDYIVQSPRDPGQPSTIWGYPVFESEQMPSADAPNTKFVGFANPKLLFFADRKQLEMDITTQATLTTAGNLWETDQIAVKFTERVGLLWTIGAGTAVLKTAAA